jgi:hypothetical protein
MEFTHVLLIYAISVILTITIIILLAFEQSNFVDLKTYAYSQGKFLVDNPSNWNMDPKEKKYNLNNKEQLSTKSIQ